MSTSMYSVPSSISVEISPPLPSINSQDLLDIVTDPDSKDATSEGLSFKAAHERLKTLGHESIQLCVLRALYRKFKDGRIGAITEARNRLLTNERLARWANEYDITYNCVVADMAKRERLHASIFEAYVGAIVEEHGYDVAFHFLTPLIDKNAEDHLPTPPAVPVATPFPVQQPRMAPYPIPTPLVAPPSNIPVMYGPNGAAYAPANGATYGPANGAAAHPPYSPISPAPVHVSPPIAQPPTFPLPSAILPQPPQPSRTTGALAALRQKATQMRRIVDFREAWEGPDHQRTWTCGLLVDGVEMGTGTATTKQMAKDLAAQQVLVALGWAV